MHLTDTEDFRKTHLSDYPIGSLFVNINGLPSRLAYPIGKEKLTDSELAKLRGVAKKLGWNWKTVNVYVRV